jgi:hypothetical protein
MGEGNDSIEFEGLQQDDKLVLLVVLPLQQPDCYYRD